MTTELQPRTRQPIVLATVEHQLRQQHRLMLLPPLATTGTVMSGGWMHERLMATLAAGGPEMLIIGLGGGLVAGVVSTGMATLYAARAGALDGLPEGRKLFGGSAAVGLALALFGDAPLLVAGTYAGLLSMVPWYRKRLAARRTLKEQRLALTEAQPAPKPETSVAPEILDVEIVEPDTIVTLWQLGATRHLPDTKLIPVGPDSPNSFIVQAGPAGVTLDAANTARSKIVSALKLAIASPTSGGQDIVFDQPTDGTLKDASQLRAQIIDLELAAAAGKRVTADIEHAPGNPCAVRIGGYIDDATAYFWEFATSDGAWSGVVLGGTGMGKSSISDQLGYKAKVLGFEIAYLDPQRGASSPVLAQHAHYPALGEEAAVAFLEFLEDCADTRETWLAMHPEAGGTITWGMVAPCAQNGEIPDPDCPCGGVVPPPLIAFVEECDQVFNAVFPGTSTKLGDRFGSLAKRIRKLCMAIIGFTQLPELKTFGGSEMLRSNLPIRNFVAMFVGSNVSGTLIPGLPYSPKLLPQIQGRALACGQSTRTMQVSMDYLPRRAKAKHGVEGPYAEDLFEALPTTERYQPDRVTWERLFPKSGESVAEANRESARARFLAKTTGNATTPSAPLAPTVPAPAVAAGANVIQWPAPVVTWQPNADELRTALDDAVALVQRLFDAVKDLRDDEWITVSALAKRIGDVDEDAPLGEVQAAGRELGRVLAGVGVATTKREAGMSVTAGTLRAAWS
ncbi:hypothetical protein [Lentzea sp. NPDC092896]|uniref:hypothetical protein n=1 Tax=Lentzea sp. NPDC092896 TaxID=3364127 RepID=UPI003810C6B4